MASETTKTVDKPKRKRRLPPIGYGIEPTGPRPAPPKVARKPENTTSRKANGAEVEKGGDTDGEESHEEG